ncbi:unnamed protein product [Acanthoscelides obtectus]|uniref:Spaetzle domain-containing protein n=1 Tax=Acanthoscelides obtectus TaxID=200917 RepID=A0A9P0LE60_ACAOB|nr:unnamed protein product [Acanthoscelides obtectus]CAK1655311.1 hypothetical protein AOBTE_LOCUS19135 [Acanthoscelides obtectus]
MSSVYCVLCCFCCFMLLTKICNCHPLQNKTRCLNLRLHSLCDSPAFYPEDRIRKLLERKKKRFQILSGTVITPTSDPKGLVPQVRFDDSRDFKNLCDTKLETILPKSGIDEKGVQRYIINQPDFKQAIIFETCKNESPCVQEMMPMGYQTLCQQKYSKIRLLTFTENEAEKCKGKRSTMEYITFRVPSTCVCTITRVSTLKHP